MALEKLIKKELLHVHKLLAKRQGAQALVLTQKLLSQDRQNPDIWIADARAKYFCTDYASARNSVGFAITVAPNNRNARLLDIELLVQMGEIFEAITSLQHLEKLVSGDGVWLAKISEMYSQCGAFEAATATAQTASLLKPDSTAIRYNLAAALTATGELKQAEQEFDICIQSTPHDYDAYYNRASLRKQTRTNNHIADIQAALSAPMQNSMGVVQLNYALAKELEDIHEYEKSFAALKCGADARRKMMSYNVETDIEAMAQIARVFDEDFFAKKHSTCGQESPIFILGFPRSGTTLVDRILSAHPKVESLGELTDFAMALTSLCTTSGGKRGLIDASAHIDMKVLGESYINRALQRSKGKRFFIDKTPANFLYIGLIAAALPNAKIIHLNRNLADNGYGMYKTLFRMGYPFSYDLDDLAKYMKAKEELMDHWRHLLPEKIIDIHYEDIVTAQETQTRKLLEALGLDWNDACLDFHKNASPSATASAAQVRKPIYTSAVNRWKHYAEQLAPLTDALEIS